MSIRPPQQIDGRPHRDATVVERRGTRPLRPLIVMPAWNEEQAIPGTVAEVRAILNGIDVLVIDDGSTDSTAARATAAGAQVVRLPFNLGVGAAMRVGFKYAVRHGYDAVVQVDADGQHRPDDVPAMLDLLGSHDLVVGNRFGNRDSYQVRGPRRLAMVLLGSALGRLAGHAVPDTTSGLRATGVRLLPLYARCYPAEYLGDTIESLVIAIRSGYRVTTCPVSMRERQAGAPSQSTATAALYLGRALLVLALALVRRWPEVADHDEADVVGSRPSLPRPRTGT